MPFKLKLSIFILFGVCFLKFGALVNAQIPAPAPIPCGTSKDPEFHSLRPYQASPCTADIVPSAKFCGNDLTLISKITQRYPGNGSCTTSGATATCTYTNQPVTQDITIYLTGATLPFVGNTEDVPNSQPPTSTTPLSDKDKVNGYVSWYLNGVMNRAEDGSLKTSDLTTTNYNVVNLSGPINKLLPQAILDAQRIQTINNVAAQTNHNQIAVCAASNWGVLGDVLQIGSFGSVPCYDSGSNTRLRLSDWSTGGLSLINTITNAIGDITPNMFSKMLGTQWNHRYPPLPWDDGTGKPFATEDLYTKAYQEWKGNTCITVPVINKTVCINNPLVTDKWANLYPYIPLSSTEDLKGSMKIDNVSSATSPTTGGVTVTGVGFSGQTPATLFFPHMVEATEEASLLQSTFVAQGQDKAGNPTDVTQTSCSTVEVRSNKGDTIAFPSDSSKIKGTLNYNATYSCDFSLTYTTDQNCMTKCLKTDVPSICSGTCETLITPPPCTKNVYISLSTSGQIPEVDNLWSQLVAGPEAVFKRIFPKTNTAGSVGKIIDIPGSTNITYSGDVSGNADLKLPHLGGISEYFLNGIQTALRPKGFGNPITFDDSGSSSSCGTPVPAGTCDGSIFQKFNPPAQTTAIASTSFNANILPNLNSQLLAVYKEAERETGVPCEVIAGIHYREGSNNPNQSLQNGGPLNGKCLLDSAVEAGNLIKAKVGGNLNTWTDLITAVSRYNGGGNHNCGKGTNYKGPCPPPEGIDDPYPTNWLDARHDPMYTIYCYDYTQCSPYPYTSRLGALTIATELYHSEK